MADSSKSMALDLVFVVDCTGSMSSYIQQVQQNLTRIIDEITQKAGIDLRMAVITYRDHPPQDSTYVTRVTPFTADIAIVRRAVDEMAADGGGDGPEAVTAAFKDLLALQYRDKVTKIAVFIADAPPHAIGEDGDGFPNEDPSGVDLLEIVASLAEKEVIVYAVGCEPAISTYRNARDLMKAIAQKTHGRYVTLANVALLSTIITGGALEEVSLAQAEGEIQRAVQAEATASARPIEAVLGDAAAMARVQRSLTERGVSSHQLQVDSVAENNTDETRVRTFMTSPCVAAARASMPAPPAPRPTPSIACLGMPSPSHAPTPRARTMARVSAMRDVPTPMAMPPMPMAMPPMPMAACAAPPMPRMSLADAAPVAEMAALSAPSSFAALPPPMMQEQQASIQRTPLTAEQIARVAARSMLRPTPS